MQRRHRNCQIVNPNSPIERILLCSIVKTAQQQKSYLYGTYSSQITLVVLQIKPYLFEARIGYDYRPTEGYAHDSCRLEETTKHSFHLEYLNKSPILTKYDGPEG